jgi:hypothetical protein
MQNVGAGEMENEECRMANDEWKPRGMACEREGTKLRHARVSPILHSSFIILHSLSRV